MITELTKEQEAMLDVYRDRGIAKGFSVEVVPEEEIIEIVHEVNEKILQKKRTPVFVMQSPLAAWKAVNYFTLEKTNPNKITKAQLEKKLKTYKPKESINFIWPYIDGQFSSYYFAFYDYMQEVLNIELIENYEDYKKIQKFGLFYSLDDVTVFGFHSKEINVAFGVLHADGKPAILYPDGFSVWCLHGVHVTKQIAETPADKLPVKLVIDEENAEVRKEIIRKIGIERVLAELDAKERDKDDVYELLELDLQDVNNQPYVYLKMFNPSTSEIHFERVRPNCTSIPEALAYRDGEDEYVKPQVLT